MFQDCSTSQNRAVGGFRLKIFVRHSRDIPQLLSLLQTDVPHAAAHAESKTDFALEEVGVVLMKGLSCAFCVCGNVLQSLKHPFNGLVESDVRRLTSPDRDETIQVVDHLMWLELEGL